MFATTAFQPLAAVGRHPNTRMTSFQKPAPVLCPPSLNKPLTTPCTVTTYPLFLYTEVIARVTAPGKASKPREHVVQPQVKAVTEDSFVSPQKKYQGQKRRAHDRDGHRSRGARRRGCTGDVARCVTQALEQRGRGKLLCAIAIEGEVGKGRAHGVLACTAPLCRDTGGQP